MAAMDILPPESSVNIDFKTQKYDRQLRLWKAHGQQALEQTSLCLINANPVGSELLKNLVLPGIGSFTIVDGKVVEPADLGNNFFITLDSIGQPRAKVVSDLLKELNSEVNSFHVNE
ncbi:NEDD8-activating enzyme E1 regulatory subunit, partial [Nowakowskiella sp. JEL0078]